MLEPAGNLTSLGVSGCRGGGNSSSSPWFCSRSSLPFPRVPVLRQKMAGEGGSMELQMLGGAQLMPLLHLLFFLQPPSGIHPHRHDRAHGWVLPPAAIPSSLAHSHIVVTGQVFMILQASPLLSCAVSICHPLKPLPEKP